MLNKLYHGYSYNHVVTTIVTIDAPLPLWAAFFFPEILIKVRIMCIILPPGWKCRKCAGQSNPSRGRLGTGCIAFLGAGSTRLLCTSWPGSHRHWDCLYFPCFALFWVERTRVDGGKHNRQCWATSRHKEESRGTLSTIFPPGAAYLSCKMLQMIRDAWKTTDHKGECLACADWCR